METALNVALGLGLSAAAGFRVFVPMLALSIAALTGSVELSSGFSWIGTPQALVVFSTATVLEVLAYAVPWIDNLMDSLATPAAVLAGVVATASVATELPPLVKWIVALIGGGGAAGMIQGAWAVLRMKSTVFTGGLANPLLSAGELAGSAFTSMLALLAPLVTLALLVLVAMLAYRIGGSLVFGRQTQR
jgi:hypothetical protein